MANVAQIPADMLSPKALRGLIEEFVTREGTDYGSHVYTLADKVDAVMAQLDRGDVVIVYDADLETCNLVTRQQAGHLS